MFFYPDCLKWQLNFKLQIFCKCLSMCLGILAMYIIKLYYPVPSVYLSLIWLMRLFSRCCMSAALLSSGYAFIELKDPQCMWLSRREQFARWVPAALFFTFAAILFVIPNNFLGPVSNAVEKELAISRLFEILGLLLVWFELEVNTQINALLASNNFGKGVTARHKGRLVSGLIIALHLLAWCVSLYLFSFQREPKLWSPTSPLCYSLLCNHVVYFVMKLSEWLKSYRSGRELMTVYEAELPLHGPENAPVQLSLEPASHLGPDFRSCSSNLSEDEVEELSFLSQVVSVY